MSPQALPLDARLVPIPPQALTHLARKDRRLAEVMALLSPPQRELMPDLFAALLHAIVGQQISGKAQAAVWGRLLATLGQLSPDTVCAAAPERLRACGLSSRKVAWVQEAAVRFVRGDLDPARLVSLSDDDFCTTLCSLPGVGRWTAEMLLIFCLGRPDVLSFGDFGILRGLRMLYRHKSIDKSRFEQYRRRYSPYGTVASLYLWAIAGGAIPEWSDPAA